MTVRRSILLVLIGIQAVILGYLLDDYVVPSAVLILAVGGAFGRFSIRLSRRTTYAAFPALAGVLLVRWWVLPLSGTKAVMFGGIGIVPVLCFSAAQFLLTLEALQLFSKREDSGLSRAIPFCAVATVTCASYIRLDDQGVYQAMAIAFAAALAAYLGLGATRKGTAPETRRMQRRILSGIVVAAALVTGTGVSWCLETYEKDLDDLLSRLAEPPKLVRTGLSRQTEFSNVAEMKESHNVALRVVSEQAPGYLRGEACSTYHVNAVEHRPQWLPLRNAGDLTPSLRQPQGLPGPETEQNAFVIREVAATAWKGLTVHPAGAAGTLMFMPLDAAVVHASAPELAVDDNGVVEAKALRWGMEYSVFVPSGMSGAEAGHTPLPKARIESFLEAPQGLDARIVELAQRLFENCANSDEKIGAVKAFFEPFTYHLGIAVPEGEDPLAYFLLERPPAHCEYFATGAAILLRLGGVPCRYVTGFVVAEKNPYGEYWVARNSDAHAWVEAYRPESGWFTLEVTPTDGIPSASPRTKLGYLWDYVKFLTKQSVVLILEDGVRGVAVVLLSFSRAVGRALFGTVPGALALGSLFVLASTMVVRRLLRRRSPAMPHDPLSRAFWKLLARMDRRVKRQGLKRRRGETLHRFARRVAAEDPDAGVGLRAAAWYETYAAIRYSGRADTCDLDRLRESLP